ncbi:transcriptional regulator containing a DNA-binding HTH domain and an aminotransferase domain [Solibacillus silvestris StLB046]|uniref:Transcriptional regulator containing a DNA-binding HTH domain and an aminotransferase domain n=1 Tax=Solibacillus silvestris (strain StLB046) TaxID=1002809 RepID=F2F5P7_SOLSS|nr:transcriptional regulator containing a DNA-binding HTH domain and an aminotransferase domain [Solibacillus silvestris StLB046]
MVVGNSCPERAVRISVCVIKYCLPYNFHIVWLLCACYDIPNLVGRFLERQAGIWYKKLV